MDIVFNNFAIKVSVRHLKKWHATANGGRYVLCERGTYDQAERLVKADDETTHMIYPVDGLEIGVPLGEVECISVQIVESLDTYVAKARSFNPGNRCEIKEIAFKSTSLFPISNKVSDPTVTVGIKRLVIGVAY